MAFKGFGKTDIGNMRSNNEDCFYVSNSQIGDFENLYIIADGMGGHKAGEIASQNALKFFLEYIENNGDCENITEHMQKAVTYSNEKVYKLSISKDEFRGMGTTFTACFIRENVLYYVHVGDSRLYIINDDINQITEDHTFVNAMIKSGKLSKEEAHNHPNRNMITKALGADDVISADSGEIKLKENDRIILCSDGLTNMITDTEIMNMFKNSADEKIVDMLIDSAKENGGVDNITVIVIQ